MRLMLIYIFVFGLSLSIVGQDLDIIGGELRYGENQMPDTFDPVTSIQNMANVRLMELMFESLLDEDEYGNFRAKLAAKMPAIEATRVTFTLRNDVTWHDLQPFTSNDVKFTFDLLRNTQTISDPYLKKLMNNFSDCYTNGPTEVIFELRQPIDEPYYLFTFKIVPRHIIGTDYMQRQNPFVRNPIGTGPFKFVRHKDNSVRVEVYKGYRERRAYLDGLKMEYISDQQTLLNSLIYGGLDAVVQIRNRDIAQLESSGFFNIRQYNSLSFSYLGYNFNHPVLRERKVRLAITAAIDREQILRVHYFGKGQLISGPYPPASPYNNPEVKPYRFDPALARQFLDEIGCVDSDDDGTLEYHGMPLAFELLIETNGPSSSQMEGAAEAIKDYLEFVGIKLDIKYMDVQGFLETVFGNKEFDIVLSGWVFDAANDVSSLFHTGGYNNFISYANSDVDVIVDAITNSVDPDEKRLLNYNLHEKLFIESPYTFLWTLDKYAAIHNKVRGSEDIHPFKFFTFIRNWYIPIDEQ